MTFSQTAVVLPCRRVEDLSLRRTADEADQLLSAWSALWHPSLLSASTALPRWVSIDDPHEDVAGHLLVVPECSATLLPEGWLDQAAAQGTCLVRTSGGRESIATAALAQLDSGPSQVAPEVAADFFALGFCHFQVAILTRHLPYTNDLDLDALCAEVIGAAKAALAIDGEAARQGLDSALGRLQQAREYSYPSELFLLDLTLVAPTTLGQPLRDELASGRAINVMVSGEVIEEMASQEPETLRALRAAVEQGTASIVGGEFTEQALSLLPPEAIRRQIQRGLASYERHLGVRPVIFGRRRFGLTPVLPQILERMGFSGGVNFTLDGGRFPVANHHSRVCWEGIDTTPMNTIARVPLDATRADEFLLLPETLANRLAGDHAPTVPFAHWPGQASPWYGDLARIAAWSPVLGGFRTIDDYLELTQLAGEPNQYPPDEYRSPYLEQAVAGGQTDPISRWARFFARQTAIEALESVDALAALVSGQTTPDHKDSDHNDSDRKNPDREAIAVIAAEIDQTLAAENEPANDLGNRISRLFEEATGRLARSICGDDATRPPGCLLVNPFSFPRRICAETPGLIGAPEVSPAVRAVDATAETPSVVVDVPGLGFAWVGPDDHGERASQATVPKDSRRRRGRKHDPPLAEENVLRNEFFEVLIDPQTGAMRAVYDYHHRSARLSQQLAMRLPFFGQDSAEDDEAYSIMRADRTAVTSSGPLFGEIVSEGELVDREAQSLARFRQATRVLRGSRVIELRIELDIGRAPDADPWHSYYAARFAWGDATANLYRGVSLANLPTDVTQLDAPHFVDIRGEDTRTTLLCGGLPYHRRFGLRKLDTLLAVRGETARRFRLGVGIDLPHPVPAALDFLAPPMVVPGAAMPTVPSSWLFDVDTANVTATHWEPLASDGQIEGFRVRLLETDGRRTPIGLGSFRPIASAEKTRASDATPEALLIAGDRIKLTLNPHEWAEVVAWFGS